MKAVINSYKTAPSYITKGKEYEVTWDKEGKSIKFIADNGKECVDQLVSLHFKGVKWKIIN